MPHNRLFYLALPEPHVTYPEARWGATKFVGVSTRAARLRGDDLFKPAAPQAAPHRAAPLTAACSAPSAVPPAPAPCRRSCAPV